MSSATCIILNLPRSRFDGWLHGERRAWESCQEEVLRRLAPAEVLLADSVEEAASLAHQGALHGFRRIIAAGGDATLHGVVNGLMRLAPSHRQTLQVGILTLARPGAFSRTLNLPTPVERQLDILAAGHTLPCDVMRADLEDFQGRSLTRYFISGARIGAQGLGAAREEWSQGASLRRELAALTRRYTAPAVSLLRLEGEGQVLYHGQAPLVLIMSGRYYPGLGEITPTANQGDGLLEVCWLEGAGGLRRMPGLLRMTLPPPLGRPMGPWRSLEDARVSAQDRGGMLELDGQTAGALPAAFTVLRRELPMIVESVAVRWRLPARELAATPGRSGLAGHLRRATRLRGAGV